MILCKLLVAVAVICCMIFVYGEVESDNVGSDKNWCFEMRKRYNIEPGKSFGQLPANMHDKYLSSRCYRFFCQPHPRAGKGVFDCDPLPQAIARMKDLSWCRMQFVFAEDISPIPHPLYQLRYPRFPEYFHWVYITEPRCLSCCEDVFTL